MKYRCFAVAVVLIVSGWMPGLAQSPDDRVAPEPPPPPGVQGTRPKGLARFLESLSPETRKRFEAAREKALQDPKLQELRQAAAEANKNFFRAMRDKMLEIDPGLADIVKELAGERKGWKRWRGSPSGFGNLSEEELDKFISAREKAKSDPAVQTADKKRRDANTPEQRNAASEDYRKAMREAMVKADPSIESLLEKIAAKPPPPPPNPANSEPSGEQGGPTSR
ncbi:MAG TPA: hypothetical protein VIS96_18495 [Terrimicrobiaceae bacterium]